MERMLIRLGINRIVWNNNEKCWHEEQISLPDSVPMDDKPDKAECGRRWVKMMTEPQLMLEADADEFLTFMTNWHKCFTVGEEGESNIRMAVDDIRQHRETLTRGNLLAMCANCLTAEYRMKHERQLAFLSANVGGRKTRNTETLNQWAEKSKREGQLSEEGKHPDQLRVKKQLQDRELELRKKRVLGPQNNGYRNNRRGRGRGRGRGGSRGRGRGRGRGRWSRPNRRPYYQNQHQQQQWNQGGQSFQQQQQQQPQALPEQNFGQQQWQSQSRGGGRGGGRGRGRGRGQS